MFDDPGSNPDRRPLRDRGYTQMHRQGRRETAKSAAEPAPLPVALFAPPRVGLTWVQDQTLSDRISTNDRGGGGGDGGDDGRYGAAPYHRTRRPPARRDASPPGRGHQDQSPSLPGHDRAECRWHQA